MKQPRYFYNNNVSALLQEAELMCSKKEKHTSVAITRWETLYTQSPPRSIGFHLHLIYRPLFSSSSNNDLPCPWSPHCLSPSTSSFKHHRSSAALGCVTSPPRLLPINFGADGRALLSLCEPDWQELVIRLRRPAVIRRSALPHLFRPMIVLALPSLSLSLSLYVYLLQPVTHRVSIHRLDQNFYCHWSSVHTRTVTHKAEVVGHKIVNLYDCKSPRERKTRLNSQYFCGLC